jgi:peptidoglycan-associated lipoprotein
LVTILIRGILLAIVLEGGVMEFKLNHIAKIILVGTLIVSLAACTSHKRRDAMAINDANASYGAGAEATGLGEESNFGDQGGSHRLASNKRTFYFDYDSNVVHDADKPYIASNAKKLAANPNSKIMLEGHTDPRGSREYNIGLGERRAKAIGEVMISKGVNPSQIRVVSYGAEKLASTGRTESDYQQDRRGVIVHSNN